MGRATFLQPRKKQNTLFNTVLVTTCDLYFLLFTFFSVFACGNTIRFDFVLYNPINLNDV